MQYKNLPFINPSIWLANAIKYPIISGQEYGGSAKHMTGYKDVKYSCMATTANFSW